MKLAINPQTSPYPGRVSRIVIKPWRQLTTDEFFELVRLRTEVFFVEQRIDEPDFDEADRADSTQHFWIADDEGAAAYLRVVKLSEPELGAMRSFGRVAVRADRRGEGLARVLIQAVVDTYGAEPMVIHSQAYVVPLYENFGFVAVGEGYLEAGLPHQMMVRPAGL